MESWRNSRRRQARRDETADEDDEETLSLARRGGGGDLEKGEMIEGNPEAERMFAWAAYGAYACPGAGPLVYYF